LEQGMNRLPEILGDALSIACIFALLWAFLILT
jgi:hypothetical protein